MNPGPSDGQNISKKHHIVVTLSLNLITSVLIVVALSFERWDYTTYKFAGIINRTCTSELVCHSDRDTTQSNRYLYWNKKNESVEQDCSRLIDSEHGVIMYMDKSITDNCSASNEELLNFRNTSILLPENAGIWRICRDIDENSATWSIITSWCPGIQRCIAYMGELEKYCCNGVCPYEKETIKELDGSGHSSREAIHTAISSSIVTVILQIISYVEVVMSLISHYVTITRLTGITVMLSGVFLAFSLIMNHYKINQSSRSLLYLPKEMADNREVQIGWCMWVGWIGVILSVLACIAWIQFSRHLVDVTHKGELEQSRKTPNRPKSRAMRELSAAPRNLALRAKNRLMSKSNGNHNLPVRSVSVMA